MSAKNKITRIWLLSLGIILFAGVLVLRLYLVQIVHGDEFSLKAQDQYLRHSPNVFDRGSIFFQNKDGDLIPAAVQKTGFALSINPSSINNYKVIYDELSSVIDLEEEYFLAKFNKGGIHQKIADRLNLKQAEAIRNLNFKGVNIYEEKWRHYPGENMASRVLGLVAYKDNELGGRYGLERFYEDILKRSDNRVYANFFAEIFSGVKDSISTNLSSSKEGNIVTTLEPSVQAFFESELENLNNQWNSDFSGGIVINPKNGEIVALSVFPHFNPNNFQNEEDSSIFSNPLVESIFEMGSIAKTLTLAAGIDSGAIKPETVYFDSGEIFVDNYRISNFDGESRGLVDMQSVLNNSLNTGAAFVVRQMGNNNFAEYLKDFGLGDRTGIDLPNEAANLIGNLDGGRDVEYITASFGQGIAVTPVAMVKALSALANDGVLASPHLLKSVEYVDGTSEEFPKKTGKRVLKSETAEQISRMLVNTVDDALQKGEVKISNYSVAAKTGTAQIARTDARGYYDDRFFHSFFGYFPAFEPKFLVFLFSYYPKEVRYASETLTHPFMNITKYLINYYEIPPDR